MLIKKAASQYLTLKAMMDSVRHNEMKSGLYVPNEASRIPETPLIDKLSDSGPLSPKGMAGYVMLCSSKLDSRNFMPGASPMEHKAVMGDIKGRKILADGRGLVHVNEMHLWPPEDLGGRMASGPLEDTYLSLFGKLHMPGADVPPPPATKYPAGSLVSKNPVPSRVWEECRREGWALDMQNVSDALMASSQRDHIVGKLMGLEIPENVELTADNEALYRKALAIRKLVDRKVLERKVLPGRVFTYRVPVNSGGERKSAILVALKAAPDDPRMIMKTMYQEPQDEIHLDLAYGRLRDVEPL